MEPVQTFDYNHASKNSDKPEQKPDKDYSRETSFNKYSRYSNSPSRPQSESYRSHEQPPRPPRINFEKNSFNKNKSYDRNKHDDNRDSPVYNKDTCRFESKRTPQYESNSDKFDTQSNERNERRSKNSPQKFESNIEYDDIEDEDPFADEENLENKNSEREKDAEKFINQSNPALNVPETKTNSSVMMVEDLLVPPGRNSRPQRIVIMLRGPPGSGKTFLAKLIKDKEVC